MKNLLPVFSILALTLIGACGKSDKSEPDNIRFEQVNKTIIASQTDSISGACKDIVFDIIGNETDGFQAYISSNSFPILCDGGNQFLVDEKTNQIIALKENTEVPANGTWINNSKLYLDQFAGQGEMYIGYRIWSYPSGKKIYYFGWIKIGLSANKETLTILSRATNQTEFNMISTGQIK